MTEELKALLSSMLDNKELVAMAAYLEARNQGPEGITAVCLVIKNRHDLWGQSYQQVCLGKNQFECFDKAEELAERIARHWDTVIAEDKALTRCYAIAQAVVDGKLPSFIGKSTCYKRYDCRSPWFDKEIKAEKLIEQCRIKDHVFYVEKRFLNRA
jgi:hypothetical protein